MPSRRETLILIGAALASTSCSPGDDKNKILHLTSLLKELSLLEWAVKIGNDLYKQDTNLANSQSIVTLFDQYFTNPITTSLGEFKKSVRTQIEKDYQDNKITSYEGWVFSQKETVLYVLAYMFFENVSVI